MARKILLADDSVTAQNMGRKILTDAGYEVITVNNGSSALKKITEAKPDLIVLDVYMPGYSGLEVCQRVKESRDLSQIPVLLTVGKLEPFKQDEARRARADAFIIKPFEATELLAAVGKLQDKLAAVPAPAPTKEGRLAAATMASFERVMSESAPKFGDQDSGWKARLTIPTGGPKLPDVEPETAASTTTGFRDLAEKRASSPATKEAASSPERPIPTGIPQDITADEIAAITAAAARVNVGMSVGKDFERFRQDSNRFEPGAVVEKPDVDRKEEKPSIDVSSEPSETKGESIAKEAVSAAAADVPVSQVAVAVATETAGMDVTAHPAETSRQADARTTPAVVSAVAAEPATLAVASRWVAEEVAVGADEAVLVLEREMHKAFAAFAAAEYAALPPDQRGAIDKDDEPMFATMAPPAIGSPVPVATEAETATEKSEKSSETTKPEPHGAGPQLVTKPPAASFAPAAALEVDEEAHAVAAFGGPDPFGKSDEVEADTAVTSATPVAAKPEDIIPQAASAKAAAEAVASAALKELEKPANVPEDQKSIQEAAMAAAAGAEASGSDTNLSSLVDSMLAELKPKLMAELAKKLEQKK